MDENNRKEKKPTYVDQNPLTSLCAGLCLLGAGLFWLTQIVHVSTGFFGFHFGSFDVGGGLVVVPLIIGIVWMFVNPKSLPAKILSALGGVIIFAAVIMSVRFYVRDTSLYTFLLIIIMVAAGSGLILRVLFYNPKNK